MTDIQITTHESLGNETADTYMGLNGKSVPGGFAGYVPQNAGYAVCADCAKEHYTESLESDSGGIVYESSEWDYPGAICDRCDNRLDTYLLVYENQDPKLHFRVRMSEFYGEYGSVLSVEDIAERARQQAYELGWSQGEPFAGGYSGAEISEVPSYPSDTAHYANVVAPKLRSFAGYTDAGHETYQQVPIDEAHAILHKSVHDAFHAGYFDRLRGNGKMETLE